MSELKDMCERINAELGATYAFAPYIGWGASSDPFVIGWGPPDTFEEAADNLRRAAETMQERNSDYRATDLLHARLMALLFPDITLDGADDVHRFSMFNMMMIKLTRYAANYHAGGHDDSLTDLINYTAALQVIDRRQLAASNTLVP